MPTSPDAHSSYSIRNDIESLHSLDNQLAKEHPDWTQKQVQAERHFRWKHGMGQAQIDSYKAEKRGDESMKSKEAFWDIKDGGLTHPNYGSFQKVIDNAVSEEERVSLIAWRDAAIHAESGSQFLSLDYHNGLAIRYADAWIKTSDGRIQQQVRANIANGGDLNGQEALSFLSRLTKKGRELVVNNKHNVGFVVIRPATGVAVNLMKELSATNKTARTTVPSIDRYVNHKKGGELRQENGVRRDSIFDQVKNIFAKPDHAGDVLVRRVNGESAGSKGHDVHINLLSNRLSGERPKSTERKVSKKTINSQIEKSIDRYERKLKRMEIRSEMQKIVQPQKELRVGKEKIKQLFLHRTERCSAKKKLEKMRTFRMNESFKKLTKKEWRAFRRKEKTLRVHEIKLSQSKERRKIRREEMLFRKKEKKILLRKERKIMRRKEILLWKTLKRLVQKTERSVVSKKIKQKEKLQKITVVKKEIRQTKKQEKQHVIKFSIAVVLWLLMRPPEKRRDVKVTKHEKSKKLVVKESVPWLLLAIIWHLAMIREGGNRTVYKQKKAKKQARQYYSASIPPQGVIFAFTS